MPRGPSIQKTFYATTTGLDCARDELIKKIRLEQEQQYMKMLVDVPKYEIKHDDIFDSMSYVLSGDYIRPFSIIKLDKDEKETNKMKAKKCDRCGKLYEMPVNGENTGAEVRFRYLPVNDESDLSEKKIVEKQTKNIYINSISVDVDICPECRESFKKWWESDSKK